MCDQIYNKNKKSIAFLFKDFFPPENSLARWVLTLSTILNDLIYVNKHFLNLMSKPESGKRSNGELLYFYRLAVSHCREAIKFICWFDKYNEVKAFVREMDSKTQDKYNSIKLKGVPYKDSFLKTYIKPIRDNFFHYYVSEEDENEYILKLSSMEDFKTQILINGDKLCGIDLEYANQFALNLDFEGYTDEEFYELLDKTSSLISELIGFSYDIISSYIIEKMDKRKL